MPTPTIEELRKKTPAKSVADKPEHQSLLRNPLATKGKVPTGPRLPSAGPAKRTELPGRYLTLEQPPISAFDDNPVFNEFGAATIVGVSAEQLKKWRQRNMGPDYIQYGPGGPVRYTINALMEFRATHTIKPEKKKK
jgi:hypothetical protein